MAYVLIIAWIVSGFLIGRWLERTGRFGEHSEDRRFKHMLLPALAGPLILLAVRPWKITFPTNVLEQGVKSAMTIRRVPSTRELVRISAVAVAALVTLMVLVLLFMSWRTIDPGYVGIVFDKASRRVTNTLDPGWVFINPFTQSITKYPIGIQTLVMVQKEQEGTVQGDDSVKVGSKEGQTMNADVSVQYTVERDHAAQLYQTWAGAPIERIEDNLVRQVTRSALNDIASQYGWEEMYGEKRIEYTTRVSKALQQRFGEKFVKFESLNLRGWHLPENLQKVVDQKIAAQQAAEQQKFALQQAQTKAQQDKVTAEGQANALRQQAEGEADARRTRAKAEADATRIQAEAQAQANERLARSVTSDLIRYQQVQKWDGKVPVFNAGNATPLVDVNGVMSTNPR